LPFTSPGFVDHHAHLLRASSGQPAPWKDLGEVRAFHDKCAEAGRTPVDELEKLKPKGLADNLLVGLEEARRQGICEIWEAGIRSWAYLDALGELRERGELPVRVRLLVAAGLAETGMRPRTSDPMLEVEGVKFYADGWLGTRTCSLSHPFLDDEESQGHLFEDADHLARRIEPFAKEGWTIATHAIGDEAIDAVLSAYEKVYGADCSTQAPRIEHAQVLRDDLSDRIAEMGVVVCIQPGFALDDKAEADKAIGDLWPGAYKWSALLERGARVITGSDYPVDGLAPLAGLAKLVANPYDEMSVATAAGLMTSEAAGSVTLSSDPSATAPDSISSIEVLGTEVRAD
jgi:predicted amidohydrolase YtcJ